MRQQVKVTEDELARLVEEKGMSRSDIAKHYGVTLTEVKEVFNSSERLSKLRANKSPKLVLVSGDEEVDETTTENVEVKQEEEENKVLTKQLHDDNF